MTTNDKVYAFMRTIVAERCLAGFIHGHTAEDLLDEMTAERVPPLPTSDTSVSKLASAANLQAQSAPAGFGNLADFANAQSAAGQQGANLGSQVDGQLSSVPPEPPKAA